VAIHKDSVIF